MNNVITLMMKHLKHRNMKYRVNYQKNLEKNPILGHYPHILKNTKQPNTSWIAYRAS